MQGISEKVWLAQGIFDIPTSQVSTALTQTNSAEIIRTLTLYSSCLSFQKSSRKPVMHMGSPSTVAQDLFSSLPAEAPPATQPGCPGHTVLVWHLQTEEQQIVAARSTEHSPRWTSTGLLRAQNKSLVPTPLKLWGI